MTKVYGKLESRARDVFVFHAPQISYIVFGSVYRTVDTMKVSSASGVRDSHFRRFPPGKVSSLFGFATMATFAGPSEPHCSEVWEKRTRVVHNTCQLIYLFVID